jgi:uncharacterized protein (DUF1800 family)
VISRALTRWPTRTSAAVIAALRGGRRGGGGGTPPPAPVISDHAASRFLHQATFGATEAEISAVKTMGYAGWIDDQLAIPAQPKRFENYFMRVEIPFGILQANMTPYINSVHAAHAAYCVSGEDNVRMRVMWAFSQFIVSSTINDIMPEMHHAWLDVLYKNALGNFRNMLRDVTYSYAMAKWLTFMQNQKEDPATGRLPDENYAREILQLFSIGLWRLNPDGTRILRGQLDPTDPYYVPGSTDPVPTYDQQDIRGLAKVFTGFSHGVGASPVTPSLTVEQGEFFEFWPRNAAGDGGNEKYFFGLQIWPYYHSKSEKSYLGITVPAMAANADQAACDADVATALDTIFNHPSCGPFVCGHLIRNLVTSNPSPSYVARVTAKFNDNGFGVRGDMKAVVRQILLDSEARSTSRPYYFGRHKDHFQRFVGMRRCLEMTPSAGYEYNTLANTLVPYNSPTVFNYFQPSFAPPDEVLPLGLVAPEMQIHNDASVIEYNNGEAGFVRFAVPFHASQPDQYRSAYTFLDQSDPVAMVEKLNTLLCAGQMNEAAKARIVAHISSVTTYGTPGANTEHDRIRCALSAFFTAPDYVVLT